MTFVVGLTGGIGSGKTLISDRFAKLGVPVIDTDVIARKVVAPGQSTLQSLVNAFDKQILSVDGTLDRNVLRKIAFANAENKKLLDSITHPAIGAEVFKQVAGVTYPYCVVVVPLLQTGSQFTSLMQRILIVTADHQSKIKRVQKRSNLLPDEVERIMQAQSSDAQRRQFADDELENNGSKKDAYQKVDKLHGQYLKLAVASTD